MSIEARPTGFALAAVTACLLGACAGEFPDEPKSAATELETAPVRVPNTINDLANALGDQGRGDHPDKCVPLRAPSEQVDSSRPQDECNGLEQAQWEVRKEDGMQ